MCTSPPPRPASPPCALATHLGFANSPKSPALQLARHPYRLARTPSFPFFLRVHNSFHNRTAPTPPRAPRRALRARAARVAVHHFSCHPMILVESKVAGMAGSGRGRPTPEPGRAGMPRIRGLPGAAAWLAAAVIAACVCSLGGVSRCRKVS